MSECRQNKNIDCKPQSILVIGGGRWAREIIGVTQNLLTNQDKITVCTKINFNVVIGWLETKAFSNVSVVEELESLELSEYTAVIIVNSASDHYSTAMMMMDHNLPILIEKPMVSTSKQFFDITKKASEKGLLLASANVFLYSTFIDVFADLIKTCTPQKIEFLWTDPRSYSWGKGERLYDSSTPVYQDVLPHIFSILQLVFPKTNFELNTLTLERGGAKVLLELTMGEAVCEIHLERNSKQRERKLIVRCKSDENYCYDFKSEPPAIYKNGNVINSVSVGKYHRTPLNELMFRFLSAVKGDGMDFRLDPQYSLLPSQFNEIITEPYREKLNEWISNQIENKLELTDDLVYALEELFQQNVRLNRADLNTKIRDYTSHRRVDL